MKLEKQISGLRSDREGVVVRKAQAEQARCQIEEARSRATELGARIDDVRMQKEDYEYLAKVFGAGRDPVVRDPISRAERVDPSFGNANQSALGGIDVR